jgi:hypothetical protein
MDGGGKFPHQRTTDDGGRVPIVATIIPHPRRLCQGVRPPKPPNLALLRGQRETTSPSAIAGGTPAPFSRLRSAPAPFPLPPLGEGGKGGGGKLSPPFGDSTRRQSKGIDPTVRECSFLLPCYQREKGFLLFSVGSMSLCLFPCYLREKREITFLLDSRLYIPLYSKILLGGFLGGN